MTEGPNPMQGAVDLGDGLTPIDIWQGLHANARSWADVPYGASQSQDRVLIDGTDLGVLKALENYPAQDWLAMCNAVGMTVYGAIGLSWCTGGSLADVAMGWAESGFILKAEAAALRPAKLVNPAVIPANPDLKSIIAFCENDPLQICLVVVALEAQLVLNLETDALAGATANIAAVLDWVTSKHPELLSEAQTPVKQKWLAAYADTEFAV